jgi:hypothetical protein
MLCCSSQFASELPANLQAHKPRALVRQGLNPRWTEKGSLQVNRAQRRPASPDDVPAAVLRFLADAQLVTIRPSGAGHS